MNAKKCKKLRRLAEKLTKGQPERLYQGAEFSKQRKFKDGTSGFLKSMSFRLSPTSTRGAYRLMKREKVNN